MIHRIYRPKLDSRSETIWLTIYADLITNLALVFLALYGLTVMGDGAVAKAVQSMRLEDIEALDKDPDAFESIAPALQRTIPADIDISISEDTGAVRLQFGERILFRSGQAAPRPEARAIIKSVADVLRDVPYTIVIEGHTDSVPLKQGGAFQNNWDLSLARAMSITRLLHEEGGIPEKHLAAAGYGQNRPRASNLTAKGRRMNRRVEVALFRDFRRSGSRRAPGMKPASPPPLLGRDFNAAFKTANR